MLANLLILTAFALQCNINNRIDCGYNKISEETCEQRGCCFDSKSGLCFWPGEGVDIKKVHVLQSNHFDAGYADLTVNILNRYFDSFFPRAADVGSQLASLGGEENLKWMTQGYIVSMYLDCPPNIGLHCPDDQAKAKFLDAVAKGYIWWHAFPHNAELALAPREFLEASIRYTQKLARDSKMPNIPAVLSQRDVVGLPRSSIPAMLNAGLQGFSIGSNGACQFSNVPPIFRWVDSGTSPDFETINGAESVKKPSGESIIGMFHGLGYGGLTDKNALPIVQIPGCDTVLIYAWRGDNQGPPGSAKEVQGNWETIRQWFPNATTIKGSTFEAFLEDAKPHFDQLWDMKGEAADTWMFGIGSDPWKVAIARIIYRQRQACINSNQCDGSDRRFANFSRLAVKNMEHTWGLSVWHFGSLQKSGYMNDDFHARLAAKDPIYGNFTASWVEQRTIGIDLPLEALEDHPLRQSILKEIAELRTWPPKLQSSDSSKACTLGGWAELEYNDNGSITSFRRKGGSRAYSADSQVFLSLIYQSLNETSDLIPWDNTYLIPPHTSNEYGKIDDFNSSHIDASPTLINSKCDGNSLQLDLKFPDLVHKEYGAPNEATIVITNSSNGSIDIEVILFDKTPTRHPEGTFVQFTAPGFSAENVFLDKVGEWVSPSEAFQGSSKGMHAVESGVFVADGDRGMFFETLDAPLVKLGKMLPLPLPIFDEIDYSQGFSFVLHDNIWNTNYPYWYPFVDDDKDMKYRFRVHITDPAAKNQKF